MSEEARSVLQRLEERRLSAAAVQALLSCVPGEDLPWLDERVRRLSVYTFHQETRLPQILSFNASGYEREAAVKQLAQWRDGSELPYLLLRVNDWVPQVREAAKNAVFDRIRDDYFDTFVRNLALIARLERTQRADHTELIARLTDFFASEHGRAALLAEMPRAPRLIARFLLARPSPAVIEAMLGHADDVIRLRAMRLVKEDATFERMASDPSPMVRKEAILALPAVPKRALLDRSAAVREAARFRLKRPREEYAALYRKEGLLMGLAEVGGAADARFAASFLEHPRASVRRDAIRCIARLGDASFVDAITPMLDDPSAAVSGAARNFLRKHGASVDAARLIGLRTAHGQQNAIQVMAALPKWTSIICLLRAGAHEHVHRWIADYNRSQTVPSARELEELRTALEESSLDEHDVRQIRFIIRSLGGSA